MKTHPLFFLGTLGMAALVACHDGDRPTPESAETPPAPKVQGDSVILPSETARQASIGIADARSPGETIIRVTGRLTWNDDTTVRIYPSVEGRVEKIIAQPGQKISAGDCLAMLWSAEFAQAQADANRAAADVRLAERTLQRQKDLLAHGAAAQKDVEAAENDHASKVAENERALSQLQRYGVAPGSVDGQFPLKSPLAGKLVEKTINPGQEVRPDQMLAGDARIVKPLFVVSDPSRLWVMLDVSETDVSTVHAGQKLEIRSRAFPDKVFHGTLEMIGSSLDPQTRAVQVRGSVDNAEGLLKAEMYVNADIIVEPGQSLPHTLAPASAHGDRAKATAQAEIPVNAVFSKDEKRYVFVDKGGGAFQRQAVDLGPEGHGLVAVINGVSAGQRVVVEGSLLLEAIMENSHD